MPLTLRILLAATVLTVSSVVLGVILGGGPADEPPTTGGPATDPSSSTSDRPAAVAGLEVRRAPFCSTVADAVAAEALGEVVASSAGYDSGETTRIDGDLTDVVHEYGCTWRSRQSTAQAWVFAPPVTPDRAAELVDDARGQEGCREADGPRFGSPGVALLCAQGARTEASYRGLFGDAWLTCTLLPAAADVRGQPVSALRDRAARWCSAVATAAAVPAGAREAPDQATG